MADITRDSFVASRHNTAVVFQKGRPPFDNEFNELQDIARYEATATAKQWLTRNASSGMGQGFRPKQAPSGQENNDFIVSKGVLWRNGTFYEVEADILYSAQRDENNNAMTALAPPGTGTRNDVVYLDVYTAEIAATQDSLLLDPTYNRETARRRRKMALVKVFSLTGGQDPNTPSAFLPAAPAGHEYYVLAVLARTTANAITNSNLTQWPLELWVDVAGSDTNNGLRQTSALRTIKEAVARVPMYLFEDVKIMVVARSATDSVDPSTGKSFWEEDIRIENVFGMPRQYVRDVAETDGLTELIAPEHDGVKCPVYRLWIQPYLYHVPAYAYNDVFYLDGSITIHNSVGVKILGCRQRSNPSGGAGYTVDASSQILFAKCLSESNGGNGWTILNSQVDFLSFGAFTNAGAGLDIRASEVGLYSSVYSDSNQLGISATSGAYVVMGTTPAFLSAAPYGATVIRQLSNNAEGLLVTHGAKLEMVFTSAPANRLKVAGGGASSIGVHARYNGIIDLAYTDVGNLAPYVGPQAVGMQADTGGVLRVHQATISGLNPNTSALISNFTGFNATESGQGILFETVTISDCILNAIRVANHSTVTIAASGGVSAVLCNFAGATRGSQTERVHVSNHSTMLLIGGSSSGLYALSLSGYGASYGGTKPNKGMAIIGWSVVKASPGSASTATLIVDRCDSVGREIVADLRGGGSVLGNDNIKLDSAIGSTPTKAGGSAHYYAGGANRAANGTVSGSLTGHFDFVSDTDDGQGI